MTGFDIIGDIHGYAEKLRGLLSRLGYREHEGAHRHPDRQAIFVGDLIDRGPGQAETVRLVRSMVDASSARIVMGNHEFNALSYATPDPDVPGDYARTHEGEKGMTHFGDHAAFLQDFPFGSSKHREALTWFRSLPLWLSLDGFRVIHACWHNPSIESLAARFLGSDGLSDEFVLEANRNGSVEHGLIETTLKGPELKLSSYGAPPFRDKGLRLREEARIRWWDEEATTLRAAAEIQSGALGEDMKPYPELPETPCDEGERFRYSQEMKPVFFGHYWRSGLPSLAGARTVCVDYSAGSKGEPLVAYRFDGEGDLSDTNFVSFPD